MPSEPSRQLIDQAVASLKNGKYPEALRLLDKAVEIDPDKAEVYELRGVAFAQMGRAEAATESFRKASELDPSAKSIFNLAVHLYNIGDTAEAFETVRRCLKIDPKHAEAKQLLAKLSGNGADPQFSVDGRAIDPTALAYKRRYGFGRKHLFAVLAENQEAWVAFGWTIIGLSLVSAAAMIVFSPFHAPSKMNNHDVLGGLRPLGTPVAFANISFFLTTVLASMIWTSLDLIDRRGRALWMIPMMLCCFTCAPFLGQSFYMMIGRQDPN